MKRNSTNRPDLRLLPLLALCTLLAGCGHLPSIFGPQPQAKVPLAKESSSPAQDGDGNRRNLSGLQKTDKSLEEIIAGPPTAGVTDEALFRLAVGNLRTTRDASGKAQQLLNRLVKEYPESSWSELGKPLIDLLEAVAEQRRQLSTLKTQNQALSKETKELHQALDQLKNLDLELEKKSRR